MAVYYVLGITLVVWGLGLAVYGLLREDFPPSGAAGRALVGVTVLIVAGTLAALLASTHKEHPRLDADAEAAKLKQEQSTGKGQAPAGTTTPPGATPEEQPSAPKPSAQRPSTTGGGAKTISVTEKEFSIALAGGTDLKAGRYTFAVKNSGQIQHDLTIEGDGVKDAKTKLIDGGKTGALKVELKPARYKFYCSVPGHEQAGMKVQVTVK
jgi:uncharacterized cupredoxin-like copper-binding protein